MLESGRRPLTALHASDLTRLRTKFTALGAPLGIFSLLREAMEADLVIGDAVEGAGTLRPVDEHLLASHVSAVVTWTLSPDRGKTSATARAG